MLIGNLAIESFWLHARNLAEFFHHPRNGSEVGVASASDFTKSQRFDPKMDLQKLIDEINIQVSHLQYGRPSDFQEKLNSARMAYVKSAITKAVKRFEADLTDEARAVWAPRHDLQIKTTTQTVTACTVVSSTASIGSISVVFPSSTINVTLRSD
jgi:hypothetical protein